MARAQADLPITLSVLDRLIDNEPKVSSELPLSRSQSVRQLKNSLRRDLEWLLNTRRISPEPGDALPQLGRSVYTFGIPDFSLYNIASAKDQTKLLRILQSAVKVFEPRLANVRIVPVEILTTGTRKVRFRIEGLLMMDPAPELVSFDTVLQLNNGEYQVTGGPDAG
jgi:type VI secretion system protein ImpF